MIEQIREHLRLLSIFHYVVGGIGYLISLIPIIHLAMGLFFLFAPEKFFEPVNLPLPPTEVSSEAEAGTGTVADPIPVGNVNDVFPARLFGILFTVIPILIILAGFTVSTLIIVAGRRLARHRSHTFCLIIAGIECMFMPFGTVLGVFTILVLLKPEARQLFGLPDHGAITAA